jgi:hypothetical protein
MKGSEDFDSHPVTDGEADGLLDASFARADSAERFTRCRHLRSLLLNGLDSQQARSISA